MPLTWKLSDWLRGTSTKLRPRRKTRRGRLPVESLEPRVVLSATGSVSGFAFVDANGDGIRNFLDLNHNTTQDSGEAELVVKGATLHLTGTSDAGATVNAQVTTDQTGAFQFTVVPAGTYTLKADGNSAVSGTLGSGVTVIVATSAVTKDVPIDGVIVTGELLLNNATSVSTFDSLEDLPLPTAGTGQSSGINEAPTLRSGQPADINVAPNAAQKSVDLTGVFDDPNIATSQIQIHTNQGDVNVNLLDKDAPQTVQNFYNYVNSGAYNDSIFHRLASGFVLQGGGFKYTEKVGAVPASITAIPTNPAVKNEFDGTNRSNLEGTVAMAKVGSDPNSATNQFFFNLADNHTNLDNQNGGFTVFGRLADPDDLALVQKMSTTTGTSKIKKFDASNATGVAAAVRGALSDLPLDDYKNGVAKTTAEINATSPPNPNDKTGSTFPVDTTSDSFLQITGVNTIVRDEALTYTIISNSNRALFADPDHLIKDNRLLLNFAANVSGTATIVVRATDKHGVATGTANNPDAIFHVTANSNPVFTSSATVNKDTSTTNVVTVVASDADLPAQIVTFTLAGGVDEDFFNITSAGVLKFNVLPEPGTYTVIVRASDGLGGSSTQTITVNVSAAP